MAASKLINLEMTKKEAKAELGGECTAPNSDKMDLPRFPYGTSLRLDTETLKKLGLDPSDYPPGTECEITGKGVVTDTNQSQRQGGKERLSMEIQFTDVAIGESVTSKKKKAEDAHMNSISAPQADDED